MRPDFEKYPDKLVPAIIQDSETNVVLMLGYMNEEAYDQTLLQNSVTFYSRSKQRLWVKGETSGNFLSVEYVSLDCDNDCLLISVKALGPVCHTGAATCFNQPNQNKRFLETLEKIIKDRRAQPQEDSYVSKLFNKGINKIAQKVGEEAVELVIEAKDSNDELFKNEAADLLFHYLILLNAKGLSLNDIENVLELRNKK